MPKTPFSKENAAFSEKAHYRAREIIYPYVFNTAPHLLVYENTILGSNSRNDILDGEMGVDRVIKATNDRLRDYLQFTIQERFRHIEYSQYRDITITEWNNNSALKSELYKINAGLFVYGYYDETKNSFTEVIVVDVACLLLDLAAGVITPHRKQNRKNQDFICLQFNDLIRRGLVVCHFISDKIKPCSIDLALFNRPKIKIMK